MNWMVLRNKRELYGYMLVVGLIVLALTFDMERGSEWSYYRSWLYMLPMCMTAIGLLFGDYVVKTILDRGYGYTLTSRESIKMGIIAFTAFWSYEFTSVISMSMKLVDGGVHAYFTEGYFEYTTLMYVLMYLVVVGLILLMLNTIETVSFFVQKWSGKRSAE